MEEAGVLLDSLSSSNDRLWPDAWPPMVFDKPLQVGAAGGHGPIRYFVKAYEPGRNIHFQFTGPSGFNGYHRFELREISGGETQLKHILIMNTSGMAQFTWPLFFRHLHDALVEEAFDKAERELGLVPEGHQRSGWVRFLRKLFEMKERKKRR